MSHRRSWWVVDPAAGNRVVLWIGHATAGVARALARKQARTLRRNLTVTDTAPRTVKPRGVNPRTRSSKRSRPVRHRMRARKRHASATQHRRRRRRHNPGAPALAAAVGTFRKFHGFDPETVTRVPAAIRTIPATLVRLGDLLEVSYRSNKFDRKTRDYVHRFGTPRPLLCTRPDGRGLFIVGGRFRNTARGIVG